MKRCIALVLAFAIFLSLNVFGSAKEDGILVSPYSE